MTTLYSAMSAKDHFPSDFSDQDIRTILQMEKSFRMFITRDLITQLARKFAQLKIQFSKIKSTELS